MKYKKHQMIPSLVDLDISTGLYENEHMNNFY